MHVGLLPIAHDRDRTLERDDRTPFARVPLRERDARRAGRHDPTGETRGLAVVRGQDRLCRQRLAPPVGSREGVQTVGVDHRRDAAGVTESGDHEIIRPRCVRQAGPNEEHASPFVRHGRELSGGTRRDDARLRFGERKERHVRVLTGDGLDDGSRCGDRDDSRSAAERRARRKKGGARISERATDDEHAASSFLAGVLRQRFERGADGACVEHRGPPLGQRSPTATATARSRMCEMETESGLFSPIASRRASARPWRVTVG